MTFNRVLQRGYPIAVLGPSILEADADYSKEWPVWVGLVGVNTSYRSILGYAAIPTISLRVSSFVLESPACHFAEAISC